MPNRLALSLALLAGFALPGSAFAGTAVAVADLRGTNEVPSIITGASGKFAATVTDTAIKYKFTFSGLTGDSLFAHIHVGERHTNGGVTVFLCNNTQTGPMPNLCPHGSGTIEGTITSADVIGPAGQGVDAAEFTALLDAIKAGATYANIHTSVFPTGEIRGQLLQIGKVSSPN
jgi:hypothetical protein